MSVTRDVDDEPTPGLYPDGRPDPAYAAALGIVPAPSGRRSVAFLTDAAGFAVLAVPTVIGLAQLTGPVIAANGDMSKVDAAAAMPALVLLLVGQASTAVYGLVQLIVHGRRGRTIGKSAFGIRSVRATTFAAPGFWRVTCRALVLWASQVVLPIAGPTVLLLSSTWDPERRGRSWLDRIGGCYAIDVRDGLDPFDAKALRHARRALDAPTASAAQRLPSLATDRPLDEHTFIPAARSSSGVVSDGSGDGWTPPPLHVPPSAPTAATTTASFAFVFEDGTRLPLGASGLIGRHPAPGPEEDGMQLVPVDDPQMRISKTHLAFGVDGRGVWVTDRASKNGTFLDVPGGARRRLEPWVREHLPAGSVVHVGGRSFVVASTVGADR